MRRNTWVARVSEGGRVSGRGGKAVEIMDGAISEGAWAGDFTAAGLLRSPFRCGSGVVVDGDDLVVLPPSHSLESIYIYEKAGALWLSNSVQCLIALEPAAAPPEFGKMRRAARTLTKGKLAYERVLSETDAGRLLRFAFQPVRISRKNLAIRETVELLRGGCQFANFAAYRDHLHDVLRSILANGRDSKRVSPYGALVTTCSGGYDSAVCAVLASELGCKLAVTVRTARGGRLDSGRPVAESLGIPCLEFERAATDIEDTTPGEKSPRVDVEQMTTVEHHDFLASIGTSEDLYFAPFAPHLTGNIVLTGFHGDKVWARGCPSGELIKRGDSSGSGLDEFRKRLGFVHVPTPFIGAEAANDLARIGESEEMRPWLRNAGDYERPLARRLVEAAGVPREFFGRKKAAASVLLSNSSRASREAFNDLIAEYRGALDTARRWEM